MQSVAEFYRNLPKKQCAVCGHEMEELHEVYMNECFECHDTPGADE